MSETSCVVCGAADHQEVASLADWQAWWATRRPNTGIARAIEGSARIPGMSRFVRCGGCDLYRVERLPSAAEVAPFYDDYGEYAQKAERKISRASRRLLQLRLLGARGSFLDVGANLGFATEAARRRGFDAYGIDIDAQAIATGQRQFPEIRLERATAEEFAATGFQADLVYCSEVIEHLCEPAHFAAALAQLTKPGGRLYLTTPDAGHWRRPEPFIAWDEVKPPEHLIWFSRSNLTRLLTAAGFSSLRFAPSLKPRIRLTARR